MDLTENDVLIIHGANPAYALPNAADQIRRAGTVVYLGTLVDETAELATWCLPVDAPLEAWGDYEPCAGIHGLMQPTMARLYDTRPAGDILLSVAAAAGNPLTREGTSEAPADFEAWLRARWRELAGQQAQQYVVEVRGSNMVRIAGSKSGLATWPRCALLPIRSQSTTTASREAST